MVSTSFGNLEHVLPDCRLGLRPEGSGILINCIQIGVAILMRVGGNDLSILALQLPLLIQADALGLLVGTSLAELS